MQTGKRWSLGVIALCLLLSFPIPGQAITRYVDVNSTDPRSPYTNPTNAAVTIQAAVDVAVSNDLILVSDGVYSNGGRCMGR